MTEVALTNIRHGNKDGTIVEVEEGGKVDKLPSDVRDELRELGSIGEPAMTQADKDEEKEELLDKIAKLQEELAEAQLRQKAPATPSPDAKTEAKPAPKAPAK